MPISAVTRSKQQTQAHYDKLSRWYDWLAECSEQQVRDAGLQKLKVTAGETILEIGCGAGHGLQALAQSAGLAGRVFGFDLSVGMLSVSQRRLNRAGLAARVVLNCGDAAHLPLAANSFEAIFLSFTLELFDTPEIPTVLQECQRVLHNEGRLGVVALSRRGQAGLVVKLYEWANQKFPQYIDCRPIFVQQAVAEAGFQVLDVLEMSTWGLPVEIVLARTT